MSLFIGLTLYAPLASFGAIAVGERRESWSRPAKSAVLGIVAAALGLDRVDESGQAALVAGYGYAVRSDRPGTPLADYHTVQVPPRKRGFPTRRDELASERLETILSRRDYRIEALHTVLLWARDTAPTSVEAIAAALGRPHFLLYLGRKACPFGLPLTPRLVEGATVIGAFDAYDGLMTLAERSLRDSLGLMPDENGSISTDADAPVPLGGQSLRRERRRDEALSRAGWRFGLRDELILTRKPGSPS
jgi:CRISPR system Cascade subunit CasD